MTKQNSDKKVSKSYLKRLLDILTEEPKCWDNIIDTMILNWDDKKIFDYSQVIKNGIIRGIKLNKIEKVVVPEIKTKYKDHLYKLA